jgi:hypothetical protein
MVPRPSLNWKRIVPFALAAIFAIAVIRKIIDQEYIYATIAAVLTVFQLILGFKGITTTSAPLSDSISEVSDFLSGSQDGTDL